MSKEEDNNKKFNSTDTQALQVKEVMDLLPPLQLSRPIHDNLPNVPGVITMIMRVKSGKTNFLANLLLGSSFYGGDPHIFDMIYIISPTARIDKSSQHYFREEYKDRIVVFDDMDNLDGLLRDILSFQESFDVKDPDNQPPLTALCFDDISGFLKRNSLVAHIFTRYRHYNLSLFCLNQTCRDLPTQVRSQTTALMLSSCYSLLEKQKILEEYGDLYRNKLLPVWDYCVQERFNYAYLKLDDESPRIFRIGSLGCQEIDYMKYPSVHPHQVANYLDQQDNFMTFDKNNVNTVNKNNDEQSIHKIQADNKKSK